MDEDDEPEEDERLYTYDALGWPPRQQIECLDDEGPQSINAPEVNAEIGEGPDSWLI